MFMHETAFLYVGISAYAVEGNDVTMDSEYVARDGVLYLVISRDGESKAIASDVLVSIPSAFEGTSLTTATTTTAIGGHAIAVVENLETFVGTNIKVFGQSYEYKLVTTTEGEGDQAVVVNTHTKAEATAITNVIYSNAKLQSATFPVMTTIKTTATGIVRNAALASFEIPTTVTSIPSVTLLNFNNAMTTVFVGCNYEGTTTLIAATGNMKKLETVVYLGNVTTTNKVINNAKYSTLKNIYLRDAAAVTAAADNVSFKLQTNATISVYQPVVE